jgi:hypothetical protein
MSEMIIPEEELKKREALIRQLTERFRRERSIDADDLFYGSAYRHYVVFAEPLALDALGLPEMEEARVLYNEYYWFLLFSKLYQVKHGYDAGLKQQAFELLDRSHVNIDWAIVEEIANHVSKEVARLT